MAQTILVFYSHNLWTKKIKRKIQRRIHWIFQLVGSLAAIIGMIIEYIGRERKGKSHFTSYHALFGLIAGILALISLCGGISALWSIELKRYARPICFKMGHSLFGIITFVLGKNFWLEFQKR